MALETPIANFQFSTGTLRGTQLSLYGARLLHHGVGQMDSMALGAIAALKEAGLRERVKVMVGGAPVTAAWAEEIGADGYGANAGMAVERAKELVG